MAYGTNAPFGLRPVSSILGGCWTEKTNEYKIHASADGQTTYATSIFAGDPVVFSPTLAQFGTVARYLPAFADATPSTFSALPILGVFQSCEYLDITARLIQSPFWPASTNVYPGTSIKAFVIDDPDIVYDIQVSTSKDAAANAFIAPPNFPVINTTAANNGSFGSNFALNIGGGADFDTVNNAAGTNAGYANNPATGSIISGQSVFYLDASTTTVINNDHDYSKLVATLPLKVIGYMLNPENIAAPGLTMATTPFLNVRVIINNHVYRAGSAGTTLA